MKVLIQQPATGLFYKSAQEWVSDSSQAMEFQDTLQAYDFCARYTRSEAQIFLCSTDPVASMSIKPAHPAVR